MGGAGRGVNRALGLNRGGTINRAFGGSQNIAIAIGIVAAVALPFALPAIATAIGTSLAVSPLVASTLAGTLYGASTGALSGSMTGNVGKGALIGGAGGAAGGFVQGGGLTEVSNALFGPSTTVVPETGQAISGASYENLAGSSGMPEGFSSAATAPSAQAPASYSAAGYGTPVQASSQVSGIVGAATTPGPATIPTGSELPAGAVAPSAQGSQFSRFLGGVTGSKAPLDLTTAEGVGRALSPIASPGVIAGVGQLAMTMFNRPPESLTPQERSYVSETAELAGTNRALFEQRVNSARRLLQQGTPNPEEAYAQANMGVQRRFREAGLRDASDTRRSLIEGARLGSAAIPGEYARAASLTQAGLSAMPSTAPQGAEGMALPVYRDLERRQREYQADLARGFGTLAGGTSGRSRGGLFG